MGSEIKSEGLYMISLKVPTGHPRAAKRMMVTWVSVQGGIQMVFKLWSWKGSLRE